MVVGFATETVEWVGGSRNNLLYVRTKIIYYEVTSKVRINNVSLEQLQSYLQLITES